MPFIVLTIFINDLLRDVQCVKIQLCPNLDVKKLFELLLSIEVFMSNAINVRIAAFYCPRRPKDEDVIH
jgi:hypothetical protein